MQFVYVDSTDLEFLDSVAQTRVFEALCDALPTLDLRAELNCRGPQASTLKRPDVLDL